MMDYIKPEIEIIEFSVVDVITESVETEDNELGRD